MLTIAAFRLQQFSRIFFVVRSGLFTVCFGAIFNLIRQWILSDREKQVICIISITIKNFLDIFRWYWTWHDKVIGKESETFERASVSILLMNNVIWKWVKLFLLTTPNEYLPMLFRAGKKIAKKEDIDEFVVLNEELWLHAFNATGWACWAIVSDDDKLWARNKSNENDFAFKVLVWSNALPNRIKSE